MSITGPGCSHCNFNGVVDWQDRPFAKGARPIDCKPCDHCGGFSQFKGARDRNAEAVAILSDLAKNAPWASDDGKLWYCTLCGAGDIPYSEIIENLAHRSYCPWLRARRFVEAK